MSEITRAAGPYRGRSSASAYGGLVWAVATDRSDGPDMQSQTQATLAALDEALARLGSDRTRIVSATVYITDIALKDEMDAAWCAWIGDDPAHWPQRACVEAGLQGATLVEITVVAAPLTAEAG